MGLIRKAASISTLGIVSFRSPKEQRRRADKHRRAADRADLKATVTGRRARRRLRKATKRDLKHPDDTRGRGISLDDEVIDLTIVAPRAGEGFDDLARSAD